MDICTRVSQFSSMPASKLGKCRRGDIAHQRRLPTAKSSHGLKFVSTGFCLGPADLHNIPTLIWAFNVPKPATDPVSWGISDSPMVIPCKRSLWSTPNFFLWWLPVDQPARPCSMPCAAGFAAHSVLCRPCKTHLVVSRPFDLLVSLLWTIFAGPKR